MRLQAQPQALGKRSNYMRKITTICLTVILGHIYIQNCWCEEQPNVVSDSFKERLIHVTKTFAKHSRDEHISALNALMSEARNISEKAKIHQHLGAAYYAKYSHVESGNVQDVIGILDSSITNYDDFLNLTTNSEDWFISIRSIAWVHLTRANRLGQDGYFEACVYVLNKLENIPIITPEEEENRKRKNDSMKTETQSGLQKRVVTLSQEKLELTQEQYERTLEDIYEYFAKNSSVFNSEAGKARLNKEVRNNEVLNDFVELSE